ncbi:MAG: DUF4345 domain-containing protein [Vogesella sp.]|uniref:DUF4345 domain-containing protein n=1 Tax=Vogesella sp. TaxID=1904252 RepID=UPI003F414FBA
MNVRQLFLISTAIGLVPIALSYGLVPQQSLGELFGLQVDSVNGFHIFRAITGLYLALALFWVMGALRAGLRQAALLSLVVFMLGLAIGRVVSLLIDGLPNTLLLVYLLLELGIGVLGLLLLKRPD